MIRSRFVRSVLLVPTLFVALSCSDYSPTAPPSIAAPTQAQDGLISGLLGVVTNLLGSVLKVIVGVVDPNGIPVEAVKWAPTHVNEVRSVSGTIGYWGGTLSIPGSDFTITFPQGALSRSTAITIISDASGYVSYDMLPHGLTFAKPVLVTQKLKNTEIYGTLKVWNSFGAYFAEDPPVLGGLLKAVETTTTTIFAAPNGTAPAIQVWQLKHFSRYMLASG
jgi:hypothetical protein